MSRGAVSLGLSERLRAFFSRDQTPPRLPVLEALSGELDRVGVHTSADARLLRSMARARGPTGVLARGLEARAAEALTEFEAAVRQAEWRALRDDAAPARLERDFTALARGVKVAVLFGVEGPGEFELLTPRAVPTAPSAPSIAVAEFFAERARLAVDDTAQKRRDLELAHELLLRLSAVEHGDRAVASRLRVQVADARDRVSRAPAVRSLDELLRHLRHTARRDPRVAWRSMRSLYERAVEADDRPLAELASRAVAAVLPPDQDLGPIADRMDAARVLHWSADAGGAATTDALAAQLTQLAFELDDDARAALELAAGCARYFDVEERLSETVIEADLGKTRPVQRQVPYPTQLMTYAFTHSLDQVHQFVVSQPGAVLLDLAAGRQMVRQFLEEEPPPRPKRVMRTAVRVYVLDASGSMFGARARLRDALLISELNAIRVKAAAGLPFDPLYFAYFSDRPTALIRVDSGEAATRQLETVFRESPAQGQTDITLAVMSAFESIQLAQGRDPYLARATVVLVTDGEDRVDLELIRKTRSPFAGLDIALSFISLGEENSDLRRLVLEQQQSGGRAFFHHLTDQEVGLARTRFDSVWRTLLPQTFDPGPETFERLAPHLEALEALAAQRPVSLPVAVDQFEALFPSKAAGAAETHAVRVADLLTAIAEAASLVSAEHRATEAVALLTHLLAVYELPMPTYLSSLGAPGPAEALRKVRLLCAPFV